MNVPVGVNEIDVLAVVALRVPIECTAAGRPGLPRASTVRSLSTHWAAGSGFLYNS